MKNFNDIFSIILKEYEKTKSLDAAIEVANLTEEQKGRLFQTFAILDAFDKNAKSLSTAKRDGISRKNWLTESILTTADEQSIAEEKVEEVFDLLATESEKVKVENIKKDSKYGF